MISILLVAENKKLINQFVEKKRKNLQAIVIKIKPKKTKYSIDDIKELNRETHIFHKQVRIYLLEDFQFSSIAAQNAFLKLLEEPPTNTQFILTVPHPHLLLPTIISRTKVIKLEKKKETKEEKDLLIEEIEKIINQKTIKIPFFSFNFNEKESVSEILEKIIVFFRSRLSFDKYSPLILKEAIQLKSFLDNNNLNPQLTIDHLLIFIYKCYNDDKR